MKNRNRQVKNIKKISIPSVLFPGFSLKKEEEQFFRERADKDVLPFAVTPYYLSLIDPDDPDDALRKQCIPTANEFIIKPYESSDPLNEKEFEVSPLLVHQYRNRVLIRVTGECALYCRHCYRRSGAGRQMGKISEEILQSAADYIARHPEIEEILISGGDPLSLTDRELLHILSVLKKAKPTCIFRLCTRFPAVQPGRITGKLVKKLALFSPVWLVTQFNHPNEVSDMASRAVSLFISAGIPVLNQTVLLRGVNDSVPVLALLFRFLIVNLIKPYYIFQGDLASGTSHFRVPLKRGIEIYRELCASVSGIALPQFAIDLPGGGGKVILDSSSLNDKADGFYCIRSYGGKIHYYPDESE
jgi:lysine 2,3-aminomutase